MNDTKSPGIHYNQLIAKRQQTRNEIAKLTAAIASQQADEQRRLSDRNADIKHRNKVCQAYEDGLTAAWKEIFNEWLDKYSDRKLAELNNRVDSLAMDEQQTVAAINNFNNSLSVWTVKYQDFDACRSRWREPFIGTNTECNVAAWAISTNVKLVISQTNYSIEPAKGNPGVEFVTDQAVAAKGYMFKLLHPGIFGAIKPQLAFTITHWHNYVVATRALESLCKNMGLPFSDSQQGFKAKGEALTAELNRIRRELDEASAAFDYGRAVKAVLNDCGNSLDTFFNRADVDSAARNLKVADRITSYIYSHVSESEASALVSTTFNPLKVRQSKLNTLSAAGDSAAVKKLKAQIKELESQRDRYTRQIEEAAKEINSVYPSVMLLAGNSQGVSIETVFNSQAGHKTLSCLLGAPAAGADEQFVEWQSPVPHTRARFNYNLRPLNGRYNDADITAVLNRTVTSIMAHFRPGTLHITFVDLNAKQYHKDMFFGLMNKGLVTYISNIDALNARVKELHAKKERLNNSLPVDFVSAYESGKVQPDYELMVVFDPDFSHPELQRLMAQGPEFGISVFGLPSAATVPPAKQDFNKEPLSAGLTDLFVDSQVSADRCKAMQTICSRMGEEYDQASKAGIRWSEIGRLIGNFPGRLKAGKKVWADATRGLSVPIGLRTDNLQLDEFHFNNDQFLSLVVGQTGSGKSVFLHNIVTNLMLKYSPDQVHIHLMDFKASGLEMSDYKGAPHVKTLLLNGKDLDVAAAILKKLDSERAKINSILKNDGGKKDIFEYNQAHPDNPLPFNIVIVDECQNLFKTSKGGSTAADTISQNIINIALEGRASGFGFVLATQTRAGLDLPSNAERQLNNTYMLQCHPEDSDRLFPGKKIVVPKFHVYHQTIKRDKAEECMSKVFINRDENERVYAQLIAGAFTSDSQFCYDSDSVTCLGHEIVKRAYTRVSRSGITSMPILNIGHRLDVELSDLPVMLSHEERNANLIVSGINADRQTDRIMFDWMWALSAHNPSQARVYVLNGNPTIGRYERLHEQIDLFNSKGNCEFVYGRNDKTNRRLIELVYTEYISRKARLDAGSEEVFTPILVATMNHERIISSMDRSDTFEIATPGAGAQSTATRTSAFDLNDILVEKSERDSVGVPASGSTGGAFKFQTFGSQSSAPQRPSASPAGKTSVSYGEALAEMITGGPDCHIHFILQISQLSASTELVPDYAKRLLRAKNETMFKTQIIVQQNDRGLGADSLLDPSINHLRVLYKDLDQGNCVMVPYVVPAADLILEE